MRFQNLCLRQEREVVGIEAAPSNIPVHGYYCSTYICAKACELGH